MTREVRELRADHNFSPDDAITCVAAALRHQLRGSAALEVLLRRLPGGAFGFWNVSQPLS